MITDSNQAVPTISQRILARLMPKHFLYADDAFRAKVIWVYSMSLGSLGLLTLMVLSFAEGELPVRRLGTVCLTSLLLVVAGLMRYAANLAWVSIYVLVVSICAVFYVDFNNLSIAGPSTPLWLIPITLTALLFSGLQLMVFFGISFGLFVFNAFALYFGWLPDPILHETSWPYVQGVFVLMTGVMMLICTRGISSLAEKHLKTLQTELQQKQNRIHEISQLKVEAESSTRSKSMFLATMSHELRTPLNSVIGNAQLLARADLPEKYHTRVNDIAIAGNLLLMLINDILDFSKFEQSELNLIEEPYDLTQQLTELSRMMSPKLKAGVSFDLTLPDERVYINADQNRLAQVLMNLISNAMKFTDSGSIGLSVDALDNNGVRIEIRDTGIGISQDDIKKLFREFSQVSNNSARNMEGTGLGLAISLGLIEHMGGTIEVQSELHKGSCFSVVLPNKRIENLHVVNKHDDIVDIGFSLADTSILIVDDIAMNCTVLESMLMDFSAVNIMSVTSGLQALEYIEKHRNTDIVFMDMRMPEMDGIEATELLRKLGYQGVIIAVTANASLEDRQVCMEAGMNAFLPKPIVMESLEKTLMNILNH